MRVQVTPLHVILPRLLNSLCQHAAIIVLRSISACTIYCFTSIEHAYLTHFYNELLYQRSYLCSLIDLYIVYHGQMHAWSNISPADCIMIWKGTLLCGDYALECLLTHPRVVTSHPINRYGIYMHEYIHWVRLSHMCTWVGTQASTNPVLDWRFGDPTCEGVYPTNVALCIIRTT